MSPFYILIGLAILFALLLAALSFGRMTDDVLNRLFGRLKKQKK